MSVKEVPQLKGTVSPRANLIRGLEALEESTIQQSVVILYDEVNNQHTLMSSSSTASEVLWALEKAKEIILE